MESAFPTSLPRIWSTTRRAFWAEVPQNRSFACVTTSSVLRPSLRRRRRRRGRGPLGGLGAVPPERPRHRELSELVPDHVLGHVHGNELLAVVHGDRVSDHLGHDRRAPRPGLHDLPLVVPVHLLDGAKERVLHVRTFRDRTSHRLPASLA